MADLGFLPGVTRIMKATPADRSATAVQRDARQRRRQARQAVPAQPGHALRRRGQLARRRHDPPRLRGLGRRREEARSCARSPRAAGRRILFMRTKHQAKKLAKQLTAEGIPAVDLHGNLSQPARDRNLAAFGDGSVRVLVATDVAARGVHVDDIELVIHVDPPMEHKAYLHRSGRTARAGASGDVVTLVLPEQRRDTDDLLRKAAIKVTPQQVTATSDAVAAPHRRGRPPRQRRRPPRRAARRPPRAADARRAPTLSASAPSATVQARAVSAAVARVVVAPVAAMAYVASRDVVTLVVRVPVAPAPVVWPRRRAALAASSRAAVPLHTAPAPRTPPRHPAPVRVRVAPPPPAAPVVAVFASARSCAPTVAAVSAAVAKAHRASGPRALRWAGDDCHPPSVVSRHSGSRRTAHGELGRDVSRRAE